MRLPSHCRPSCLKVRSTVAILDEGLTINDCRLAGELGGGSNDRGISVAPIMSVAAKDTHLAALNHYLRAISIVFDFMNPMLPFWRLIDQGRKLRLDESESGMEYGKHGLGTLNRRSPDGGARASSAHHKERGDSRETITNA